MFSQRRNVFVLCLVTVCIGASASAFQVAKVRNTITKLGLPEVRQYVHTMASQSSKNFRQVYGDAKTYATKVRTDIGQEGGLRQSLGLRPRIGTRIFKSRGPQIPTEEA